MRGLLSNGPILMIVTSLFWSFNSVVGRGVHEIVPPVGLAFWRWAVTLPMFLAFAWPHLKRDWPLLVADWKWMLFLASFAVAFYNTIIYFALDRTTAINMVLINATRPGIIVAISYALYRTRVGGLQAAGLICGFIGTMTVMSRGDLDVLRNFEFNAGDLWVFVATLVWAVYTVFLPKRPKMHPASFMAYSVAIGLLVMLPFYVWESVAFEAVPLNFDAIAAILVLGFFSSFVAHMGYNRLVELIGANAAGTSSYMVMAFGVLLAILFLGEEFHLYHAAGLALLVVGSYFASRKEKTAS